MSKQFESIQTLIDKLSTRERVLVLLGILAVFFVLWDTFLMTPLQMTNKISLDERANIKEQITTLEKRRILASGLLQNKKRKKLLNEIEQIESKIGEFDNKILSRLEGRVAPEDMANLLNQVLQESKDLELISVNNLPAKPFVNKNNQENITDSEADEEQKTPMVEMEVVGIYMHTLELVLQGRYLDILDYLKVLETLQWKIFWDQVKLEVIEHPNVKVHIKVHTFSLKDGWLSV